MAANYKVLTQRRTTALTNGGQFVDVVEITFEVPGGDVGTARINAADYMNIDTVHEQLDALASQMIRVRNL